MFGDNRAGGRRAYGRRSRATTLAASRPFDDFDVNAVGTLNLLEATRQGAPEAVFVHMSTNKVYGDRPNTIRLKELSTRWDYNDIAFAGASPKISPSTRASTAFSGLKGRWRRYGAGIWPIFWHETAASAAVA